MVLDSQWAHRWMVQAHALMLEHRDCLTELDTQIGDGDHGDNMCRGFSAVVAQLEGQEFDSVGQVLRLSAKTLMSTVGGAAGPLYGTAFLRGAHMAETTVLDAQHLCAFFEAAVDGIQVRGKAHPGEKTMLDAWAPAYEAARERMEAGASVDVILTAAASAAVDGAQATIDFVATKGRASYFGVGSVGHIDPGAYSTGLIMQAAVATLNSMEGEA